MWTTFKLLLWGILGGLIGCMIGDLVFGARDFLFLWIWASLGAGVAGWVVGKLENRDNGDSQS